MMYIPSVFSAVVEQLDHVRQEDAAHLHALWASGRGFQQSRNHLQDLCHNNNNNMSTHQHQHSISLPKSHQLFQESSGQQFHSVSAVMQ